jgi:hypothetical protein
MPAATGTPGRLGTATHHAAIPHPLFQAPVNKWNRDFASRIVFNEFDSP